MAQGSAHLDVKMALQEDWIRAVVREEIARALELFGREADGMDMPYETAEIESRILTAVSDVAGRTVATMRKPEDPYNAPARALCSVCGHFVREHTHEITAYPGATACEDCPGCRKGRLQENPFEEAGHGQG